MPSAYRAAGDGARLARAMICPSCGAANDAAAEVCFTCRAVLSALTQGSIVGGRYEILSPLGRGGGGVTPA